MAESYFSYWGKASSQDKEGDAYHLLPFHALDVAACARKLLDLPHFSLRLLAEELGWPQRQVEALFVFFMALHDQGKFARAFQGLLPEPIPGLVPPNPVKRYNQRHDTLGGGCGWSLSILRLSLREYRRQTMVSGRSGCGQQPATMASRRWTVRTEGPLQQMWTQPSWQSTWKLQSISCRM